MRARKSVTANLNAFAVQEQEIQHRAIQLENLTGLDANLLRALIEAVPRDQVCYPKDSVYEVVFNDMIYRVSCNHNLLFVDCNNNKFKVHAVNMVEDVGDVIRYQYLGQLAAEAAQIKFLPSLPCLDEYVINFDHALPRSPLFDKLITAFIKSHPKTTRMYTKGDIYELQLDEVMVLLQIKVQGGIQVRPSTSQRHADEMRVDWVAAADGHLGKGTFGSVSKAPTYRLIENQLSAAKRLRITKAIPRRTYFGGIQEPFDTFATRIKRENFFAGLFGLKPKPAFIDLSNNLAYITQREVPGVTLFDWLAAQHNERQKGSLIDADLAYRVSIACLEALAGLHAKNIIHGDLKSNNMMIDFRENGEVVVQVIDAGAASYVDTPLPFDANVDYICPESDKAMHGKPGYVACNSQKADVYALGIELAYLWGFGYDNLGKTNRRYQLQGNARYVQGLSALEAGDIKRWVKGILAVAPSARYTAERAAKQVAGYYKQRLSGGILNRSDSPPRRNAK